MYDIIGQIFKGTLHNNVYIDTKIEVYGKECFALLCEERTGKLRIISVTVRVIVFQNKSRIHVNSQSHNTVFIHLLLFYKIMFRD